MSWVAATVGDHGWAISGRHGDEVAVELVRTRGKVQVSVLYSH